MSFKYLFNNNFTDNRLLQKMPNYEAEAQMFQEQLELERQKQLQQILQLIDQISQQGMTARGLSTETIGVSPQKSTKPNIDWSDPVAVNRLYHGDYGVIQGNNGSPAASITTNTTPTFDPNAGKDDLYNQLLNAYLKEYFSNRGYSKRRDRKAREYFDRMFNYDWNANVGKRKTEFEANARALAEIDAKALEEEKNLKPEPKLEPKLKTAGLNFGSVRDVQTWLTNNGFDTKGIDNMYGANTKSAIDKLLNDPNFGLTDVEKLKFRDFQNSATFYRQKAPLLNTPTFQSGRTSELVSSTLYNVTTPTFGLQVEPITLGLNMSATSINPVNTNTETTQPETSNFSNDFVGAESYYNFGRMRSDFEKLYFKLLHSGVNVPDYNTAWKQFQELYKDVGSGFMKGLFSWMLDDRYIKKNKNGGTINKYKQGNKMNNEQELQKAFMAYLIEDAAAQGIQIQSEQDLQAYAQQLGEEGLKAKYQEFMQKMQGQGIKAALGAKLNYIRKIKGMCPDGQETYFFKEGGSVKSGCKPCMAKAQKGQELKKKGNAVDQFKNRHINPNDTVWADGDKNKARTLTDDRNKPLVKGMKPYSAAEYQRDLAKGRKGDKSAARRVEKQDEKTMYACGGKSKKKKN